MNKQIKSGQKESRENAALQDGNRLVKANLTFFSKCSDQFMSLFRLLWRESLKIVQLILWSTISQVFFSWKKYDDSLRMCERKVNSTLFSCIHFILFTNWHILTVSLKLLDRVCIRKYSKRKFNNLQVLNIQFELEVKVQYHWKSRNFMKELHNSPFNFLFKKYEHFCSIISTTK